MDFQQAFFLLALCPSLFAASILSPTSISLEEGMQIALGDVGPGQTFFVTADPKESTGGKYGLGGAYDQMVAISLPIGWTSVPSKLYANPLQTEITVPKDASDGEYEVKLALWDEAGSEGLGQNLTFTVLAKVTQNVMDMRVEPTHVLAGAGQPARYAITIVNKGIANDVFTVASAGVRDWEFRRSIYIPSGTSKTLTYEVVGNDESDYEVQLLSTSSSSDRIKSERMVTLRVNTDLFSDFRAVNRGVLLFPLTEAPIYFILGILSNFI